MPVRTDADAVAAVVEIQEGDDVEQQINDASLLVDARCVPLGYTDPQLEVIERYLAAHLYLVFRPGLLMEQIGKSREQVMSKIDLGLRLTHPGQQCLVFDFLGGLSGLGEKSKRVKVLWLGTRTPPRSVVDPEL